jgi:perosamine synthetase
MNIPITKPLFGDEERRAILQPLETGWVAQGPCVAEFERRFAAYVDTPFAIATSSCTAALHLALVASGVGPGDEVIVPAFTWVATANVVEMQGARPVFVDIELDTFNIDADRIEQAITARTKVLVPVSLFGISAPMSPIVGLARKYGLKLVEDAACALGGWYRGRPAGTGGDVGCFSFHPRKVITTGEGGMLVTADEDTAARLRSLRDHGASTSDLARHRGARSYVLPDFDMVGYNYRLTDLQGAVGVAQMARLESILEQRSRLAARYLQLLSGKTALRMPVVPEGCRHGYQSFVCLFQPERVGLDTVQRLHVERNLLMDRLEAAGIATRPGTHAVHMLGYYREKYGLKPEDFPQAFLADQLTLALPLYAQMTDEEQDYVVEQIGKR